MKQESNNAIDLMLRKLGRSGSRLQPNAGNGGAESGDAHLDADELSAYAENALPPTTRARYTEHLADCVRCRQIVSQLSQVAGLVVDEAPKTAPSSGLKAFLASLFSPIVLRYAVPALGLLVVASIGFLALRSTGSMELAQRGVTTLDKAPATATSGDTGAAAPTAPSVNTTKAQPHGVIAPAEGDKTAGAKSPEQEKPADETRRQENDQPHEKAATSTDQVATAPPAGSPTETVTVAAAAKPSAVADQKQTTSEAAPNKIQAQAPQTRTAPSANDEPSTRRPAKEPAVDVFRMNEGSALKKGKRDSAAAKENARADDAEEKRERNLADKDQTETISVAGRRFRKSGSVWIDVAYNSSQGTTNVTRGSEQYRALIADEPGIRTIAEQLKGEVIVVWKGRAYRIR
jgi:hypothetical protein